MANTSGVVEVTGDVAVAEPVTTARSLWLSVLPAIRRAPVGDLLSPVLPAEREPLAVPPVTPTITIGRASVVEHGPIGDLGVSPDGRYLVAAHYGTDIVSIIDSTTLSVTATVEGISEPHSVAVAGRIYVGSASAEEDSVVAIDAKTRVPFAARPIASTTRGLAVSPAGDVLYVGRFGGEGADIAAIDIESGELEAITVSAAPGASIDVLRISADGTRLHAVLTTALGGALAVIDTRTRTVEHTVALAGSIGDIAVHPSGRRVFATGWDVERGGLIQVIDVAGARVVDTITVSGRPTQLALGCNGNTAFFVDGDEITLLDTVASEVIDRIVIGGQLSCIAAGPDGSRLYVADYAGAVTVLELGVDTESCLLELMTAELPQLEAVAASPN